MREKSMGRITVLFLVVIFSAGRMAQDPCDVGNHQVLTDVHRSTGFTIAPPAQPLCDISLAEGWYRFRSAAGDTMPTSCVQNLKCGTLVPLWMKGSHPSVNDGEVQRKACGNYYSGGPPDDPCCDQSIDIRVKNCGQFYVYRLSPTPACPVAYCAGDKEVCPVGQWSRYNLPPCQDITNPQFVFPIMTTPPTLSGPIVKDKSFEFHCTINFDEMDVDQIFEIEWLFDGQPSQNVPIQRLADPDRVAVLDGAFLRGNLDKDITCRARAFYHRVFDGLKSDYLVSEAYYAGIKLDPSTLVLDKNVYEDNVTLTSTVPVVCLHDFQALCCVDFKIDVDAANEVAVATKCRYSICTSDWDENTKTAAVNIPVVASRQIIQNLDRHVVMAFDTLLPIFGGDYLDVFAQHKPYELPIKVEQPAKFTCSLNSDPHIRTFDNVYYDLQQVGDYIAYQVPERDFKVQIRTWPCFFFGGRITATAICGVVVQEKNDIIRVYQCDQALGDSRTSPTVNIANPLREGTVIERSEDGSRIGIYLPSGTEIQITTTNLWFNVLITGPGIDSGKANGLCGTNDGIPDNDFTHPDGTTVDPKCTSCCNNCQPLPFTGAWSVDGEDSLFQALPGVVDDSEEVVYCDCKNNQVNCNVAANAPHSGLACQNCQDYRSKVAQRRWAATLGRGKRAVVFEDFDESDVPWTLPNSTMEHGDRPWPTEGGITEAEAREKCEEAIERSQLNSKCGSVNNLGESFLADCMADIRLSGSAMFVDSTTEAFRSACQYTLAKDPANYVTNTEGKQVFMAEFFEDLCDLACDEHGTCGDKGVCICDDGWEGVNCHIQSHVGPYLARIRSGSLCDKAQRPCREIFIDVSNVYLSDNLMCRVQPVDEYGNDQGPYIDTDAKFLSGTRIVCGLPETAVSSKLYKISASNDGSLFGNVLPLNVFDSVCLDCTERGCTPKSTACHIDNVCYVDGTEYNGDKNKICDVSKDTTDWTIIPMCSENQFADIIFVLDSSASFTLAEYQQQLKFVANLTEHLILGPNDVRFGAVIHFGFVQISLGLKDYPDHHSLTTTILSAPYIPVATNTALALNNVRENGMFDPPSGGRPDATKIIILMTDGFSISSTGTLQAAGLLKTAGVHIISIGVGEGVNTAQLEGIASGPDSVFHVSSADALSQIQEEVTMKTC